ncbi:hypothetical protein [Paenibacillus thermotolerans]|uniref:hypothetical protein n=1 Tax=Paenibacillus thermotolerans TaxID=3027807 RepID=UPI002368326E|nr:MULTISPECIES: hypothetical protein [unclassified Paenibacillus]
MGVKFNREYKDIVHDMTKAIGTIPDCHDFFEMDAADWSELDEKEREQCVQTMADDVFYALGSTPKLSIGSGKVDYDAENHVIKINSGNNIVHIVKLI